MSLKKCRKFLRSTEGFDQNLPPIKRQPIVLSDSKASYLHNEATRFIENEIIWWYGSGWDSNVAHTYLLSQIEEAILTYGRIHLYVWLGTCNLTVKKGRYVYLNPEHGVAQFIADCESIASLARQRKFKLTFLEIPHFSINKWNELKGHKKPDKFVLRDKVLEKRTQIANEHIQRINNLNQVTIRPLNVDLEVTRKNKARRAKRYYNHNLYKDGIHPLPELSRCWLRKLTMQIRADCY